MGSYVWKASWGPEYHQSIIIVLCSLVLSSVLGLGKFPIPSFSVSVERTLTCMCLVMRQMLIRENKRMEREEQVLTEGQRQRIEEAATLEGISFEEAVRRRRGFRYLY